jgi:transposase-like protein
LQEKSPPFSPPLLAFSGNVSLFQKRYASCLGERERVGQVVAWRWPKRIFPRIGGRLTFRRRNGIGRSGERAALQLSRRRAKHLKTGKRERGLAMRRQWDAKTKARIVLQGLMGGGVNELCRSHDLRPSQYYKWRGHFLENCHQIFEPPPGGDPGAELAAENEELKKLVGELTLELTSGKSNR